MRDTAARLAPVTDRGAREMLEEIRAKVLLRGFRGAPARHEQAYLDAIARVSTLVRICPDIQELDLNPVIVTSSGAVVVDARIRVSAGDPGRG